MNELETLTDDELAAQYGRVSWQLDVLSLRAAPIQQEKAALQQELARRHNEAAKPVETAQE